MEMILSISIECKDLDVMRIYNHTVVLEDPCNNVKHRDRNHKTKKR